MRRLLWWLRPSDTNSIERAERALEESVAERQDVEEVLQKERRLILENNFGPRIYEHLRGRL